MAMLLFIRPPRRRPAGSCAGASTLAGGGGIMIVAAALAGCASASLPAAMSEASFACQGGASFKVEYLPRQVRVTTTAGTYLLASRPSSIGQKYSSENIFFIQDEERAVLVGAAGGPFSQCEDENMQTAQADQVSDRASEERRSAR
jgi:hypothetical protein